MEIQKKILTLTLHAKAFEVMVNGEKTREYRKPSKWIDSRLFDDKYNKRDYDEVLYINGYGKHRPRFRAKYIGCSYSQKRESLEFSNGLKVEVNKGDLIITHGEILEINNY